MKAPSITHYPTPGRNRRVWVENMPAAGVLAVKRLADNLSIWGGPDKWNYDIAADTITASWEYSVDVAVEMEAAVALMNVATVASIVAQNQRSL